MLVNSKKVSLLPSVWPRTEYTLLLCTHLEKELTDLLRKVPGYSLFPHLQRRQRMANMLMVYINPTCRR